MDNQENYLVPVQWWKSLSDASKLQFCPCEFFSPYPSKKLSHFGIFEAQTRFLEDVVSKSTKKINQNKTDRHCYTLYR